jgi:2-polyprenyl-3-methyl-5-hydroxy-6-metoxy-1,4-benzoquinol methylase
MKSKINKLDYRRIKSYWNNLNQKYKGKYGQNYLIDRNNELIAKHRFLKDLSFILENLPKKKKRFLDVGCGTGNYIEVLSKQFDYCEGIDFSEDSVKIAKKKFKNRKNIKIIKKNVLNAEIKGKFDLINISEVLMYLNDIDINTLLAKLVKHLSKHGILTIRESVSTNKTVNLDREGGHMTIRRTKNDLYSLFKKSKLKVFMDRQNCDYNYVWMVLRIFSPIRPLVKNEKFLMFFLNNKLTRDIFFYSALKIVIFTRKNFIDHYYFVLNKL